MKLIGYRHAGTPCIGVVLDGRVAAIASVDEFYADVDRYFALAREMTVGELDLEALELCPPIPRGAKVWCIGFNYRSHAAEGNREIAEHPSLFARFSSTLVSTGDAVPVPIAEEGLDWEVELAAVVGKRLHGASETTAEAGVLGYAVLNDLSARVHQFHTAQWTIGKNADRSAPFGPFIVTPDELDATTLELQTRVNGTVMQKGNTRDLIFSVASTLSYISHVTTLDPGDILSTGTPAGVGFRRNPPVLLTDGDVVEVEIEGIGVLRTPIIGKQ
jgi:2-keto-4-pentenoate hydratase/2-oxohepta-3-ene-1,7-dioic acid hydratase in catechol pathway